MRLASLAVLASVLLASAQAQEGGQSPDMTQALAAGYKASFICSATFNAGQTLREIERNELDGIYVDYREAMAGLPPADIDMRMKAVSVAFSETLPPRMAVWRQGLGCTQLPIGAGPAAAAYLPRFEVWPDLSREESGILLSPDARAAPISLASYGTLEAAVDFAFDGSTYGAGARTSGVLIASGGEILIERYARGINADTPQRTWSVAKSLTATIIGAAEHQGLLDIDHDAVLQEWSGGGDPRRQITLRNLLNMASGLDSGASGSRTDRLYFGGASVAESAVTRSLEAAPGTRFKYANNDTLAAMRSLRQVMADDGAFLRFPYEALLWKIGAYNTTLEVDWQGDYISSSQVWTTARDLARIGQLYLQDGVWAGERILPEDWREFVTTPAPAQPASGSFGYGAQFWLLSREAGVPDDAFAMLGNRGQHVVIIPSYNLVIVRRGYDVAGEEGFDIARFTADIVAGIDAAHYARIAEDAAALVDPAEMAQ